MIGGLSSLATPVSLLSTLPSELVGLVDKYATHTLVGTEAEAASHYLNISRPMECGEVHNWEDMEQVRKKKKFGL